MCIILIEVNLMTKYFSNDFAGKAPIVCPYCHVYAQFDWNFKQEIKSEKHKYKLIVAKCTSCYSDSVWFQNLQTNEDVLVFPNYPSKLADPNPDMPDDIKQIYVEAAKVLNDSPRASAALSRLAIDKLTKELSNKSSLDKRIGDLVSKGLPTKLQQAFDIVRIIGNNAVHPGEIDLSDNQEMAKSLLSLLNMITDNLITQPNQIDKFYNSLPERQLKHIEKRDSKKN